MIAVGITVGVFIAGAFAPSTLTPEHQPAVAEIARATVPDAQSLNAESDKPIPPKIDEEGQLQEFELRKWTEEVIRLNAAAKIVEAKLKDAEKQSEREFYGEKTLW